MRMAKERLVVCQSHVPLSPIRFPVREDLIARHNPPFDLIEDHEPAKLHEGASFLPRDDAGMRLVQAEDFLFCRDLLALEHPCPRLVDDALDQRQYLLGRGNQPLCCLVALVRESVHHLFGLVDHMLGRGDQAAVVEPIAMDRQGLR